MKELKFFLQVHLNSQKFLQNMVAPMKSSKKLPKQPDPIFDSIAERKEYGSYLSVIKGKDKTKAQASETFEFGLTGKGVPQNHLQTEVDQISGALEN